MIETFSYTGDRVAREIEDKFGDAGNAQITRAMILAWINNGIREIGGQHDFLHGFASTNLLAGMGVYDLGQLFIAERIKSFETITVAGKPIKILPFPEYIAKINGQEIDLAVGTPGIGTVRGSSLTVWPVPDETIAAGITIYFSASPADLADITAPLTLPDRFYNALVDYVMAQALELDENFDAAQLKLGHHEAALRRELERGNASPTDFYPTITMDPYGDEEYGMTGSEPRSGDGGGYGTGGYGA